MFCPVCRSEYADDWKVCPKDAASLLRSQFVGKYRIDQILGVGGMGAVYKAYNPDTQSTVALKLMHGGTSAADASRQRFQREAASVAALRTRHVVSIYDFGSDVDGTLYLVMEYLQGHALRNEIAVAPHSPPLPRVNFIFDNALRGLTAAHRAGIVHRDLKPENLFVANTDDGEVIKILDFGIARVQRGDTPNLTHSGALMGTPAYMAPEQVAGNRGQVAAHSDVYAMGVILYELLTGVSPFHAETLSEVLSRILSRTFDPLAQLRPELPVALSQLVDRSLADDPAERFGDAGAMREAWSAAWAQLPNDLRLAPVPPYSDRRAPEQTASGPAPGRATDIPSAGTALPAHMMRSASGSTPGDRSREALAMTAAVDTGSPSTVKGGGRPNAVASPGTFDPSRSVTPGPVVVETQPVGAKKSRAGLWATVALVLVGAAAAAVFFATKKPASEAGASTAADAGIGTGTGTGTGSVAKLVDAGVVPAAIDATVAPSDSVRFAGGAFEMGVDPEKYKKFPYAEARHQVTVGAFVLDKTEVTIGAMKAAGGKPAAGADDLPASGVSWADAEATCKAMGKRLPTSAEWEMAARSAPLDGRKARLLPKKGAAGGPAKVGTHPGDCTPDGVCDLLGNVMEWTSDDWAGGTGQKVVRGASFGVAAGEPYYATVFARLPLDPAATDREIGFRCATDAPAGEK